MQFKSVIVWFFQRWVKQFVDVRFKTVNNGVMVPYFVKNIDHFLSPILWVRASYIFCFIVFSNNMLNVYAYDPSYSKIL